MGFGDEIMATADARRLKRADPSAAIVIGDGAREVWSDEAAQVFAGNPHVSRLADVGRGARVVWLRNYYGCRPYLDYPRGEPGVRQAFAPYRATPGELYFTADERAAAATTAAAVCRDGRPVVSIEPHVIVGANKDWGLPRWQALVDALRDDVVFVQPSYGKALLDGVRGIPSTFRGHAAVLAACDAHVGPEGGLHHAAAAVGCPAVVLFGGRISPRLTGYATHENLFVDVPGSPCGMIEACEHCRSCLASIAVDAVVAALRRQLAGVRRSRGTRRRRLASGVSRAATARATRRRPAPSPAGGAGRSPDE